MLGARGFARPAFALLLAAVFATSACGGAQPAAPTAPPAKPAEAAKPAASPAGAPPVPAVPAAPKPAESPAAGAAKPAASPAAAAQPAGATMTADQKAAAVKEGEVNWYTGAEANTAQALKAEAEKVLGIKVNVLRLSSGQLYGRFLQEAQQGVNATDVYEASLIEQFVDLKAKGLLAPFTPSNTALYRGPEYYDPEHFWNATRISLPAINYNRDLVKGDLVPRTWKDLTDPKYKDKLVQGHIKAGGGAVYIMSYLTKQYGWGYLESLQKNNIQTQESCTAVDLLVQGERTLAICGYSTGLNAKKQGKPIESVLPEDGVPVFIPMASVVAKAPHPNAARLFLDFLTSPAGQSVYAAGGDLSPLNTPDVVYPPGMVEDTRNVKLVVQNWQDVGEWQKSSLEKFSGLFGG